MFFDPQAHTQRGVPFQTVIDGLWQAVSNSQKNYGITSKLIMCFLRDLSAESAMETLDIATKDGAMETFIVHPDHGAHPPVLMLMDAPGIREELRDMARRLATVGFVPEENLVGKAEFLFFSLEKSASFWKIYDWPWAVRKHRLFMNVN